MGNPIVEAATLETLRRAPEKPIRGSVSGVGYTARIGIPNHAEKVASHYGAGGDRSAVPIEFPHFGVIFDFDKPVELSVCDDDRVLDQGLRETVEALGPVILRNAYLPKRDRLEGQRNIFPSLRFHLDRGSTQDDRFSLFWRDPFDEAHRLPRTSSTLIVANAVAYLQAYSEGDRSPQFKSLYQLFETQNLGDIVGKVVLEQAWRAPPGTGEIAILDNRSVLHASYYPRPEDRGYPIGVRYLY